MSESQKIYAIIPAGGIGKRMKSQKPKQFMTLADEPILTITIKALAKTGLIEKFIVPTVDIVYTKKIIKSYAADMDVEICKSGKTRQESIYNGLQLIKDAEEQPDLILIHDAVRAFVKQTTVEKVVETAKSTGAAIAARPITDTIKMTYKNDSGATVIKKNVVRDHMWRAQTPQVFKSELLIQAYDKAKADHFEGTDSAGLVERIGLETHIIESSPSNIKITHPEDLELAKMYLDL